VSEALNSNNTLTKTQNGHNTFKQATDFRGSLSGVLFQEADLGLGGAQVLPIQINAEPAFNLPMPETRDEYRFLNRFQAFLCMFP